MPTLEHEDKISSDYDRRFTATALHQAETKPGTMDMSGLEESFAAPDATPGTLSNAEKAVSPPPQWSTNVTKPSVAPQRIFAKVAKNKYAPTGIAGLLLTGGIVAIGSFSFPALLLQHITANYFNKFNLQQAAIDVRSDKILRQMFTDKGPTSGICTEVVSFRCKYHRISNKTLTLMATNPESKVIPLGKDGKPMDVKNTSLLKSRPTSFEFSDSMGKKQIINASQFADAYRNNSDFRLAVGRSYNPRWQAMNDHSLKSMLARLRISKGSAETKGKSSKELNAAIETEANGDGKVKVSNGAEPINDKDSDADKAAKKAVNENTDAALKDMASSDSVVENGSVKKLGNETLGKMMRTGNGVGFVATAYCTVAEGAKGLSTALRAAQMAVSMRAAFGMMRTSDRIREGYDTPELAAAYGDRLTATVRDEKGVVVKGAATDGYGMRNALHGERPADKRDNYLKFLPGAGASAAFNQFSAKIGGNNVAVQKGCGAINSTPGQLSLALFGGPAAIVGFLVGTAAAPFLEGVVSNIMERIIGSLVGKYFDASTIGEDYGNVIDVGARNFFSEAAAAGGGGALSREQATKYEELNAQVALSYARDDRATLSPFDISNPNTALGSVYGKLIPLFGSMNSVSSFVSRLATTTTSNIASIISPSAYAAEKAQDYTVCDDEHLKAVAAGPACNLIIGVPDQALHTITPEQVLDELKGQYDEQSGDVKEFFDGTKKKTPLKEWEENCLVGTGDAENFVKHCKADTHEHQIVALFFIDRRTMRMINSEDGSDESQGASSSSGSGGFVSGDTIQLAKQILASPNVRFQTDQQRAWFGEIAQNGKQSGCGGVAISPRLLGVILGISQKYKITIGVLVNGHDCDGAFHPKGMAVDVNGVVSLDGTRATSSGGQFIREIDLTSNPLMKDFIQDLLAIMVQAGGGGIGQVEYWKRQGVQVPSGIITFGDSNDHLHVDVGKR